MIRCGLIVFPKGSDAVFEVAVLHFDEFVPFKDLLLIAMEAATETIILLFLLIVEKIYVDVAVETLGAAII